LSSDDFIHPQMDSFDPGAGPEPIGESPAEYVPPHDEPAQEELSRDELRRQLVEQFEQWVDRMLDGEPPPQGLPDELLASVQELTGGQANLPEQGCDLYTLFAALTTLSGEIRLQGRAFKQVTESLTPLADLPGQLEQIQSAQSESADLLTRMQQQEEEASVMPSSKEVLGVLFDLYDRLQRGLRTLDTGIESLRSRSGGGWLARLGGAESRVQQAITATEGMRDVQRLLLSRLEAALHQWGIERIGEAGDLFDPQVMTAVEVQSSDQPDGTVLEIYRSGYALHGEVLATAQVKVAKR
jgi:molecular chaperone GrpE